MKILLSELRRVIREEIASRRDVSALVASPISDINSVNYGHAPLEFQTLADSTDDAIKSWFVERGLVDKIRREAPSNDSEVTKRDLLMLVEMTSKASAEDVTFARYVDNLSNLAQTFIDLLTVKGHDEDMQGFFRVETQTESLLYHLKDLINRPRPYQLAKYYGLSLCPLIRTDAMTASYPSGHAMAGFMMSEYYAKKYPDSAVELRALGKKIAESRELVGIHYPSDTEASKRIVQIIVENNLIQG